jgi:hypothetical protein
MITSTVVGIDILRGNAGADYIESGKGKDIYFASNDDTILDIDNKEQLFFDENILSEDVNAHYAKRSAHLKSAHSFSRLALI